MIGSKTGLVMLAALSLLSTGFAQPAKSESDGLPLRLALDLVDGSRIIGTPGFNSVPVQTSYAKMDVPLKQILTLKIGDDHETASVELQNGDKLKGVISLGPIKLETAFGKVSIGIEHIRAISVMAGGVLTETLKKGLVLYYPFDKDEGKHVVDASGGKHPGAVVGATWVPKGKVNGALRFNGADLIDMAADLDGMNEMTVCVWVNVQEERVGNFLGEWGGPGPSYYCWMLSFDGNEMASEPRTSGASIRNSTGTSYSVRGKSVQYGQWKHLAFSYKAGGHLTLYEDGVRVDSVAVGNFPIRAQPTYTAKIGSFQDLGDGGSRFKGLLDELMIFNRALSESEIMQIFASQK